MNRFVARLFAFLLAAVHVLAALALILLLLPDDVLPQVPRPDDVAPQAGAIGPLGILGLIVGYILAMGVVSTLVAINQNLEQLVRGVERIDTSEG